MKTIIYILEDKPAYLKTLKDQIDFFYKKNKVTWPTDGIEIKEFTSVDQMIDSIEKFSDQWRGQLLFLDLNMDENNDDSSGYEILKKLSDANVFQDVTKVIYSSSEEDDITKELEAMDIVYTDYGTNHKLSRFDICDFIQKPCDLEKSQRKLLNIFKYHFATKKILNNKENDIIEYLKTNALAGNNDEISELRKKVARIAPTTLNITLLGETGTGKTFLARAIHKCSDRNLKKFIEVNCANFADDDSSNTLFISEIFGHKKNSYNGAEERIGYFQLADNGTLFLDEIGELSLTAQVKLLKAIDEKKIVPLGSNIPIPVDIRLIFATDKDLNTMTKEGRFLPTLYNRITKVTFTIPPLRERLNDIEHIIRFLLNHLPINKSFAEVDEDVLNYIKSQSWTEGNQRELNSILEVICVLDNLDSPFNTLITKEHLNDALSFMEKSNKEKTVQKSHSLPSEKTNSEQLYNSEPITFCSQESAIQINGQFNINPKTAVEEFKKVHYERLVEKFGNQTLAAKAAGITRKTVNKNINKK